MPDEYGLIINNSAGIPVVDSRYRSMEALAWGSVYVPNRGLEFFSWPAVVQTPIVFMRCDPGGFIIRGKPITEGSIQKMCVSCDRNMTIHWVVGGFRTNNDPGAEYGLAVFDAQGRLGFSTGRRYLRFDRPPPTFASNNVVSSVGADWWIQNGVTIDPSKTYMYWPTKGCWHNSGNVNWYWSTGYGNTNMVPVVRIDAQSWYFDQGLGNIFYANPPGNAGIYPDTWMLADFVP